MKQLDEKKKRLPSFQERLWKLMGTDQSQTEFAKQIGLSRQTLGFYLNGDRIPDAEGLLKICKACNKSADWLLGITADDNSTNDEKMRQASSYTGLSNNAVSALHSVIEYNKLSVEEIEEITLDVWPEVPHNSAAILSEIICNKQFPMFIRRISELKSLTQHSAKEILSTSIQQHLKSAFEQSTDTTPNYQNEQDIVDVKEFQVSKVFTAILRDLERGVNDGGNS